jgi:hypothetical protein
MSSSQVVFEFGRIGSPGDWVSVGMAGAVLVALVLFLYRRDLRGLSTGVSILLLVLRIGALSLVAWVALDPRTVVETTVVHRPRIDVLVDASLSMETPDADGPSEVRRQSSRWRKLVETITSDLAEEWSRDRELEFFRFGKDLNPLAGPSAFADVKPTDPETRLGSAVVDVLKSKNRRLPAAVVLATDGVSNAGSSVDEAVAVARTAKVPIHSILFGSEKPPLNVRIAEVRLPPRVFRGSDDATGNATIDSPSGVEGPVEIVVEAQRGEGPRATRVLSKKTVRLTPETPSANVPITFPPAEVGRWEISVHVDVRPGEFRTDDNRASVVVEVVDRKSKVLLIAGASGREYQFLRSVLFRDKTVDLSVWLQPGRPGVSQDAARLLTKFPEERADLFAYDVIVAVDPDWRAIGDQGIRNLTDWIATQSGGVILVAGPSYWTKLPPDSPVVAISPVVPRRSVLETSNAPSTELHPIVFTPEGEATRSLALDDDLNASKKSWSEFAGVFWTAAVERLKPGARLLASAMDAPSRNQNSGDGGVPLIASQFFGSGRVLYLGAGEFWRLRRIDERLYERFWTQLVRHVGEGRLLRGSRRGGFLFDDRQIPYGNDLPVKAFALDEQFQPLRAPKLTASASTTQGQREIALEPVVGQPGRFQGLLPTPPAGSVKLQLPLPAGVVLEETLAVRESRTELDDVRIRRDILERLAAASGGKVIRPEAIHELTALLPKEAETTVLTSPPRSLWDRQWVVLLLVGLLGTEWIVRKLNRLA